MTLSWLGSLFGCKPCGHLETHSVHSAGVQLKEATLATHYVPSHLLPELESELQQLGTRASSRKAVHELLAKFEVSSLWQVGYDVDRQLA